MRAQRRRTKALVTAFVEEVADRAGMTLRLPAPTLAGVILAAADGLDDTARLPRGAQRRGDRRLT